MELIKNKVSLADLKAMSQKMYGNLVKAVVDTEKEIMVIDSGLHADEEEFLLEEGSNQKDLWGINLHPDNFGTEDFIEFDSMINIRPSWGNSSRSIDDPTIQKKIKAIVNKLVIP